MTGDIWQIRHVGRANASVQQAMVPARKQGNPCVSTNDLPYGLKKVHKRPLEELQVVVNNLALSKPLKQLSNLLENR